MEQSIRLSSKSKLRNNKIKNQKEEALIITKAFYLGGYTLLLFFNNGVQKRLDFTSILKKHLKGYYDKYLNPVEFKKFKMNNGNVYWGQNEDVIFPVEFLYNHPKAKKEKDEVVMVVS